MPQPLPARKLDPEAVDVLRTTVRAAANNPEPAVSARSITRATTIIGLMLEDLSENELRAGKTFGGWVTRIGQITWGLVELAAPRSLGAILFQYWIWLIYFVAVAMLFVGALTGGSGVIRAGVLVLLFAVAATVVVLTLRSWLRGRPWIVRAVAGTLFVLSAAGIWYFGSQIRDANDQIAQPHKWNPTTGLMGELANQKNVAALLGDPKASDKEKAEVAKANIAYAKRSLVLDWAFIPCYVVGLIACGAFIVTFCRRLPRPHIAVALVATLACFTAIADSVENARAWIALHGAESDLPYATTAKLALFTCAVVALLILAIIATVDALGRRKLAAQRLP